MHRHEGGGAPPRASGVGVGLGIGLALGAGGAIVVAAAGVAAVVLFARGPARTEARLPSPALTTKTSGAIEPPVIPSPGAGPAAPATQPAARTPAEPVAFGANTLYTRAAPAVVRIEVRDEKFRGIRLGTGFFVSSDGLLVTNFHVVDGARFATVETSDGATLFIEGVAATDKKQDLALLKVKATGLAALDLGPADRPPVGTRVFAIGHPQGLKNLVLSEGLVSGVGEALGGTVASIQTTAPISHGSSGGPLVTADGRVVGVTTAIHADARAQNLNFAVPVSLVHELLKAGRGAALKPLASAGGGSLDREQAAVLRQAWEAIDRRDLRQAASILADARARMKGSNAYWATAGALHLELKNYPLAADAFENAVRLKPDSVEAHSMLGVAYVFQDKHREAIKAFEAASRLAPRDPKFYAAAGRCHMELKQPDRAVTFYKKAMQLAPGDATYTSRLGDAYFALGQHADAMVTYEKSLKVNPNDADTLVSLAESYVSLRRSKDADEPLRKALALSPSNARAHLDTGLLQVERNQPAAALLSFQSAAKLDPGGKVGQLAGEAAATIQAQLDQEKALRQRPAQEPQPAPQPPAGRQRSRGRTATIDGGASI